MGGTKWKCNRGEERSQRQGKVAAHRVFLPERLREVEEEREN